MGWNRDRDHRVHRDPGSAGLPAKAKVQSQQVNVGPENHPSRSWFHLMISWEMRWEFSLLLIWFIPILPLCSTASRTCLFPLSRYFLDHKSQKNDPRKEKQTTQAANTNRNQAANEPSSAEVAATPQKIGKKVALPKLQDLNKMLSLHRDFFFYFFKH